MHGYAEPGGCGSDLVAGMVFMSIGKVYLLYQYPVDAKTWIRRPADSYGTAIVGAMGVQSQSSWCCIGNDEGMV